MPKRIDLLGQKYGRLKVVSKCNEKRRGETLWICECDCGSIHKATTANLRKGSVQSCGCLARELTSERSKRIASTHGLSNTRIYHIWEQIVQRCRTDFRGACWENYSGRGITICEDWRNNFLNFYEWSMANGYSENLSIDRIDGNGNYEPSNCRWVTRKVQQNNTRRNRYYTHDGVTHTLAE